MVRLSSGKAIYTIVRRGSSLAASSDEREISLGACCHEDQV
jgi:hypothetical protein